MNPKNDPDETPTRFGGSNPPDAEDRTVPSMGQGGKPQPPPPPPPKTPPAKGSDPLLGKELGGCRIESLLGRGAMGAVYRAHQVRLDRRVAVKVIRPEMMTDPRTLKRFEVEARTVGRFNSANVVMVHDVGFEQGVHYLVMEFVQGKNLRDHVKLLAGGRLPAAEAIPLLRQACKGLEEAQRLSVIHRDIKPDNLMLTDRGILKIADFGIAKPVQDDFSLTMSSELIGTPLYMSPEQCQGIADLDFRSDMYSLGATFYYLLTGEPPVRASSVYELIQTKTKLENLCLWKALPELDENHPLSRVIERMTALDREDRYPSYEALLNDIVLVEQGSTIDRIARKAPSKGELPKLLAPKKRSGGAVAWVAGLLVLAAAGGGYWWSQRDTTDHSASTGGGPADSGARDAAAVRSRLATLRGRLAKDGPSAALQKDVAAVAVEPTTKAEREQLQKDVELGLAIEARLAARKAPKPALPFDELAAHLTAVDAAARLDGAAGKELQAWVATARSAARNEHVLGLEAKSALLSAFSQWQDERRRAVGEKQLARLGEQLARIEAGRRQLLSALPALTADLDAALPVKSLDEARRGLADKTVSPVDVDIGAALAEIAVEFERTGPTSALDERTKKLLSTNTDQIAERDRLLNAFQTAEARKREAEAAKANDYPSEPLPPFDDIETYYGKLDHVLDELRRDGQLPTWAKELRARLRSEPDLQQKALVACRTAFEAWQRASESPTAAVAALEASLGSITRGIQKAVTLFPAAKEALEQVVPADALATARARLDRAQQRKDLLAGLPTLRNQLLQVRTIGDWRSQREAWLADLAALQAKAQPLADDAEVQRELRNAEQVRDRWIQASARVEEFATRFAAGDLTGARGVADASVLGSEGRDELRALGAVVGKCADAFRVLDGELDVDRALALLDDAAGLLRDYSGLAPSAVARMTAWGERLADLRRAAAAMVAVPAGNTKSGPVSAFFLGCTEVSQAEYARFLDELDGLVGGVPAAERPAKLAARLGDLVLPADQLQRMLGRRGRLPSPELPVDDVSWYEAAAYARWYGMSLPTKAEWALAAFGDNHQYAWPWGQEWKPDDASRNIGNRLVAVTSGGRSWRSTTGKEVHHLAGNAAEWLQAEPGATLGYLAGGRCQDSPSDARRRAAGEDFHEASLVKDLDGFGFRVILRPRQFLGSDFPTGRLPGGR
ncbi:MAG: protein kinase [Planctomycetes bacterium]|nr:protein kinase [Planctomycetota bacterium]